MIILDFETNSNNPKDVLEVGAYKVVRDNSTYKIIDTFHRYYHSKHEVNFFALEVHKLSPEKITQLRKGITYCKYFEDDHDFINFCRGTKSLIAHNISFELRYLDNMVYFENHFCTMKETKKIVNALNIKSHIKNPKLIETCLHYNIEFDESQYHNALYDASKVLEILNSMNHEENNFDIIQHTIEINKQKIIDDNAKKEAKRLKKIEKAKPSKRKIEREQWLKYIKCPHCSSKNIHKKDIRQRKTFRVQRYQCMDCKKVFQEKIEEKSNASDYKPKDTSVSHKIINKPIKVSISKNEKLENNLKKIEETITQKQEENEMSIIKKIFSFIGIKS